MESKKIRVLKIKKSYSSIEWIIGISVIAIMIYSRATEGPIRQFVDRNWPIVLALSFIYILLDKRKIKKEKTIDLFNDRIIFDDKVLLFCEIKNIKKIRILRR